MQEPSNEAFQPSRKITEEEMQRYTSEALERFISVPSDDYGSFLKMFRHLKEEDPKLSQPGVLQVASPIHLATVTNIQDGMELLADLEVERGVTPFSMDGPGIVKTDNFVDDEDIPTEDAVFYTPSFEAQDNNNLQQSMKFVQSTTNSNQHQYVVDEEGIRTDADIMLDEIKHLQQQGVVVDIPGFSKCESVDDDFVLVKNDPLPAIISTDSSTAAVPVEIFELDPDFDYENVPFVAKGLSKEEERHLAHLREEKIIP